MLTTDHLSLRLIRLQPGEEWAFSDGENLCFIFPTAGAGTCSWGVGTQALAPGDVSLLKSTPDGRVSISGEAGMVFQCFSARFEHFFPLFGASEIALLHTVIESLKTFKHYPASNPLAVECHKLLGEVSPRFDLDHRGQLLRILAAIFSAEFKQSSLRPWGAMRPEQHITRLFEELSIVEITDSSVSDLAKKFSCSTRHLNRIFHDYFGLSVAALRMELRLLRAASILRDPDVKVISVAEQCGFNHLGLFNTCFKRRFGVSPGQYRKSVFEARGSNGQQPSVAPTCRLQAIGLCPKAGELVKGDCAFDPSPSSDPAPARSGQAQRNSKPIERVGEVVSCVMAQKIQPVTPALELRIQV